MPKRTRNYESDLVEQLKDKDYAVEYLNAALEEDGEGFSMALKHVAQAHGVEFVTQSSGLCHVKKALDGMGFKLLIKLKTEAH
jgi:DNA-binding phage protein